MSDVEFTLFVDDVPFVVGPFKVVAEAGRPFTTRATISRTTPADNQAVRIANVQPHHTWGKNSTVESKTPDTIRVMDGNSDPVKRQLAVNYNFWLSGLSTMERLHWSRIHNGKTTAERIAAWQSGHHTQIAK